MLRCLIAANSSSHYLIMIERPIRDDAVRGWGGGFAGGMCNRVVEEEGVGYILTVFDHSKDINSMFTLSLFLQLCE